MWARKDYVPISLTERHRSEERTQGIDTSSKKGLLIPDRPSHQLGSGPGHSIHHPRFPRFRPKRRPRKLSRGKVSQCRKCPRSSRCNRRWCLYRSRPRPCCCCGV